MFWSDLQLDEIFLATVYFFNLEVIWFPTSLIILVYLKHLSVPWQIGVFQLQESEVWERTIPFLDSNEQTNGRTNEQTNKQASKQASKQTQHNTTQYTTQHNTIQLQYNTRQLPKQFHPASLQLLRLPRMGTWLGSSWRVNVCHRSLGRHPNEFALQRYLSLRRMWNFLRDVCEDFNLKCLELICALKVLICVCWPG